MLKSTTTILSQLHEVLPMHEFEGFVGQHKADLYTKTFTTENQLSVLLYAQATEKDSLRAIETGLRVQNKSWSSLGLTSVARNTLAHANERRPWQIFESLFYSLLKKCQNLIFGTAEFSFKNELYALDASVIDVCLSLFPWAKFRTSKGAVKIHALLNIRSQIPEFLVITDGSCHEVTIAQGMDFSKFPPGSIFVVDRGYTDYELLNSIRKAGHHFVIRLKSNAQVIHYEQKTIFGAGVLKDEEIEFLNDDAREAYPGKLRLVTFYDSVHDQTYEFLTDEFRLSALNIALIYKQRWQVELFFKWIKQHLKIKTFLGTSKNAVMTQIWVAMIYFLLLAFIKHQTKFAGSLLDLSRMIAEVILQKVHLIDLLSLTPKTLRRLRSHDSPQLQLF
jgi:hypothetical protein